MDQAVAPRRTRVQHRHELRNLTYFTLDHSNGGIVRNLTHEGMGGQAVAPVRPHQEVRVRFELRNPELFVVTRGEVMWTTSSGECGIRFLDVSRRMSRQIDEWIFGSMLEDASLHLERSGSVFAPSSSAESGLATAASLSAEGEDEDDGLMVSATPWNVIELPMRAALLAPVPAPDEASESIAQPVELDWLSQPLSNRGLIWTINGLVVVAALLLFALVFLSVTRELPRWPLAMGAGSAILVGLLYWGFFKSFGGTSPGERLARLIGSDLEDDEEAGDARFR